MKITKEEKLALAAGTVAHKARKITKELKAIDSVLNEEKMKVRGWSAVEVQVVLNKLCDIRLYEIDERQ